VILEGDTHWQRLEETFRRLIHRHQSLRTSFEVIDDEPIQKVHHHVEFKVEYHEPAGRSRGNPSLSRDGREDKGARMEVERILRDFIKPFDLSRAPLLRVGVIKSGESLHVLAADMHHIITDGFSLGILIKEFAAVYAHRELPPLKIQYKDYSQWLNYQTTRTAVQQQEKFWSKEFEGEIPRLTLPLDYERPVVRSFEGDSLSFQIEKKEAEGLKELAAKEDATLFMVLLAVYNVLMSKLAGQEDIVVGVGAAGRRYEELQPVIGMFVNTLALRSCPERKKPFRTFLKEVREKALMAFENQDFQFEDLVEKVVPGGERNRNPLFDIAFVLQNIHVNSPDIPKVESIGLKVSPFGYHNRVSRFDISFFCSEAGDRLLFHVEYCTGLFKKETIERFIIYYKEIVSGVLENNDIKLEDITISHNLLRAKPGNPGMELGF
jgi:hypothetical protein